MDLKHTSLSRFVAIAALAAVSTLSVSAQVILLSEDFDSLTAGDPPAATNVNTAGGSIAVSNAYANSGSNSLAVDSNGAGAWAVPNADWTFAATAGNEYSFTGSMLTPAADDITDASFGLLKLVFRDAANADLQVTTASAGTIVGPGNPGVESPQLNSASTQDVWIDVTTQAVAPAGTTQVLFIVLNVNQAVDPSAMYFDNLVGTDLTAVVPEPSAFGLIGGLIALGFIARRRR